MTFLVPLLFALILALYTGIHKERRLQKGCIVAGLIYCLYVPLESIEWFYETGYSTYMLVDLLLLLGLWRVKAPAFSVLLATVFVLYGASALALPQDNPLYTYNTALSMTLHTAMLLSLTILPRRYYWAYRSFSSTTPSSRAMVRAPITSLSRLVSWSRRFRSS